MSNGYVQVHTYTSSALIPIKNATIKITDPQGDVLAMRLTNQSGKLETPVSIPVPDASESQSPGTGVIPFTQVNIYARAEDYEQIEVENVQLFADVVNEINLKMIPLSELPESWNRTEIMQVPIQNL